MFTSVHFPLHRFNTQNYCCAPSTICAFRSRRLASRFAAESSFAALPPAAPDAMASKLGDKDCDEAIRSDKLKWSMSEGALTGALDGAPMLA
jgi:hypothetical protein